MRRSGVSALLAAALLVSAARAEDWRPPTPLAESESPWAWHAPRWYETSLMATGELLIVLDVIQTCHALDHGRSEVGLLWLGTKPGKGGVIAGAAVAGVASAVVWYIAPPRLRWMVPAFVIGAEAISISMNSEPIRF